MLTDWILGAGPPADPFAILLLALAFDAVVGDPDWFYRAVPHPVAWVGRMIEAGERRLNRADAPAGERIRRGLLLTLGVVLGAALVGWGAERALAAVPGGWLLEAILAGALLAFRGLHDHVRAVARALERGLAEGRAAVARIVGRDPERLDGPGIARAAAESAAENFSDGVVAPLFWFALLGLPGMLAYKGLNTLDSMVGYRNERFAAFGRAAARLDDAANWVPARIAGLLFVLAAALTPGASAGRAWRTMLRDAPRHRSPNAGWQEAAVAGALGLALAGPRRYGGQTIADHWMGDGRAELGAADLHAVLRLYLAAGALAAAVLGLGLALRGA